MIFLLESVLAMFLARLLFHGFMERRKKTGKSSLNVAVKTLGGIILFFGMCGLAVILFAGILYHLKRPSPEVWAPQNSQQTR